MSRKRKAISIKNKANIIFRLDNGELNKDLAKEFGVPHNTISLIKKNRDKVLQCFEEEKLERKRIRNRKYDDVEEVLLAWYKVQRNKQIPISGPILQEQANNVAKKLGKLNFQCSSSWVQRFRSRHNIVLGKMNVASAAVPVDVSDDWLDYIWPKLREYYDDDDIFSAHETGLFYRLTPDKIMKLKGERALQVNYQRKG